MSDEDFKAKYEDLKAQHEKLVESYKAQSNSMDEFVRTTTRLYTEKGELADQLLKKTDEIATLTRQVDDLKTQSEELEKLRVIIPQIQQADMEIKRVTTKNADTDKLLAETRRKLADSEARARYAIGLRNAALDLAGALKLVGKSMRDHLLGEYKPEKDPTDMTQALTTNFDNIDALLHGAVTLDAVRRFYTIVTANPENFPDISRTEGLQLLSDVLGMDKPNPYKTE